MATATDLKVKPLADRVVVKPLEEAEQMRGGLYIPDTAKEKPQQGEIVAVGNGRYEDGKRIEMELKVGRQGAVREVQRHRGDDRGRAVPDPPRERRARGGRLKRFLDLTGRDEASSHLEEAIHGCEGSGVQHRCARRAEEGR